jgi:hypothetical protein
VGVRLGWYDELLSLWGDIGIGFLVIAALGAVAVPLAARNYRSAYS